MSLLDPIPSQARRTAVVATLGQTVFNSADFKVYDPADVRVRVKLFGTTAFVTLGSGFVVELSGPAPATPVVTLAVPSVAGDVVVIEGAMLPGRTTAVTLAGALRSTLMEYEFDRLVRFGQELRRDATDALAGIEGAVNRDLSNVTSPAVARESIGAASVAIATTEAPGLMSAGDVLQLAALTTNLSAALDALAQKADVSLGNVADKVAARQNLGAASTAPATTQAAGLMSAGHVVLIGELVDAITGILTALDNRADRTLSNITDDAVARENIGAASTALATTQAAGLMSALDKGRMDGLATAVEDGLSLVNQVADQFGDLQNLVGGYDATILAHGAKLSELDEARLNQAELIDNQAQHLANVDQQLITHGEGILAGAARLDALEGDAVDQDAAIAGVRTDVDAIGETVDGLATASAAHGAQLTDQTAAIGALDNRVDEQDTALGQLDGRLDNAEASVGAAGEAIVVLRDRADAHDATLQGQAGAIATLGQRADVQADALVNQATLLGAHTTALTNQATAIGELDGRADAHDDLLATHTAALVMVDERVTGEVAARVKTDQAVATEVDARRLLAGQTKGYTLPKRGRFDEFTHKSVNAAGEVVAARDPRGRTITGLSQVRTFLGPLRGFLSDPMKAVSVTTDGVAVLLRDLKNRPITAQAPQRTFVSAARGRTLEGFTRKTANADGAVVSGMDPQGRLTTAAAPRTFKLPRRDFGRLASEWSLAGELIRVVTPAATVGLALGVGLVEERLVSAPVTGRLVRQVCLRRSPATYVFPTGGPYECALISSTTGSAKVRRNGLVQDARWRPTVVSDGTFYNLILGGGQSLMQGQTDADASADRFAAWRDPVHERAWQFDGSAIDGMERGPRPFQLPPQTGNKGVVIADGQLARIVPLRGSRHATDATWFQTFAEPCAHALLGQHLHHRDEVLAAIFGTGSTAIADFLPGTPDTAHMQSAKKIIDRAKLLAAAAGKTLRVWFVWNQGEQDNTAGTAAATWKAGGLAIRDAIRDYTVLQGGVFGGWLVHQCMQSIATAMAGQAQAELALAGECVLVPTYPMLPGWSGSTHLLPLTYLPLGSATAYAIAETIAAGALYQAPRVAAGNAKLTSPTTIDCTFTGGNGAYQFDTSTIPDAADGMKGVTVERTTNGAVTVASVSWLNATTLRVSSNEALDVADAVRVRLGLYGAAGSARMPAAAAPRVNIRDTSNWPCGITGQPVSGWAMCHQAAVTAP